MTSINRLPRRWLAWLCAWLFFGAWLPAAGAAVPDPVPVQSGLVVDQTGAISQADRQALIARLQAIQSAGRAQIAILISGGIHGEPLAEYSLRVADAWRLGWTKHDDGLLILLVPSAASMRIEVGYGLEGVITDALASRWIDECLPLLKKGQLAAGLNLLLDRIDAEIPAAEAPPQHASASNVLDRHPDWKLPFVLAVFSPFALFPLFFGRWGSVASAPLFAGFIGGAAWALWHSPIAAAVAAFAFMLPLLWGLNWLHGAPRWLRYARGLGNLFAVAIFFSVITLFVGAGLSGNVEEVWVAPLFAGLLALGLAVFLFPGQPARYLMIVLRSFVHFVLILAVAYIGLQAFIPHPAKIAFAVAGAFTACVALSLYLDSRAAAAGTNSTGAAATSRWSLWLIGLALLIALPFGLMLLVHAVLGEDFHTRVAQAAAGGGSLGGVLWWAAQRGFFGAVTIGLGGRFGGGGAER